MHGQQPSSDFVLNPAKPYVYIQFDHIGSRKPLRKGENDTGLWLRIVNNCRVPITVPTFGLTSDAPGAGVLDEVIPSEVPMAIIADAEPIATEASQKAGADKARVAPQGYSAEVYSMTRILPGKELLFSVPLNHVGDAWFMRVRFVLDVNKPSVGTGPYTYLEFFKFQISPSALGPSASKPALPVSAPAHEAEHSEGTKPQ